MDKKPAENPFPMLVIVLITVFIVANTVIDSMRKPLVSNVTGTNSNNKQQTNVNYNPAPTIVNAPNNQVLQNAPTYTVTNSGNSNIPAPVYYVNSQSNNVEGSPTIYFITPTNGTAGTQVTINGNGLQNGTISIYRTTIEIIDSPNGSNTKTLVYSIPINSTQDFNQYTFTMPKMTGMYSYESCVGKAYCSNVSYSGTTIYISVKNLYGESNLINFGYLF